jgi:hypothetical protein
MDLSQRGDLDTTGVPVQQPRPPIWVVGLWNRPKSMRRVTRFDGIVPQGVESPAELGEMVAWLGEHGVHDRFDVIAQGEDQPPAKVQEWADAGATWWIEAAWSAADPTALREKVDAGPPR